MSKIITFIKGFIMFNILWYVMSLIINMQVLPNPVDVYKNIGNLYDQDLYKHILMSMYRILLGLGISLLIGIPIGILMSYSKKWNKLLNPLVYFSYPIPKTALLPVVMLLLGLGDLSKIVLLVLIVVFQVIVTVRDSITKISQEIYVPLRSLGASKLQILMHVTLPAILPDLFTNLRLSVGTALSVLFFSEAYGTHYGIGYYILDAWTRIDYISMYAGIMIISLIGCLLFILIDVLQTKLCSWN